eukprot:GHVN01023867.1.p2 GENE.GHVN01023867.1~~GHVN01023867.1.p2  ORF type:complete len:125 (+),score=6.11 GHVN01023867.1:795-1169(+)
MSINSDDSCVMHCASSLPQTIFMICGKRLLPVAKVRDLGVFFNDSIKFNQHVDVIERRASRSIVRFKQLFRSRHKDVNLLLHLTYCATTSFTFVQYLSTPCQCGGVLLTLRGNGLREFREEFSK